MKRNWLRLIWLTLIAALALRVGWNGGSSADKATTWLVFIRSAFLAVLGWTAFWNICDNIKREWKKDASERRLDEIIQDNTLLSEAERKNMAQQIKVVVLDVGREAITDYEQWQRFKAKVQSM